MADWLRIAAPFFGQLFQERGDDLQKARERTIGLAEDRYKRYMDTGQQVGIQTLKQMMEEQSPAYQQDLATDKAQENLANVGAAAKQADLDAYKLLTPEEQKRLQLSPAIQNEAYARQVGSQEREKNKTPSQVHLENEQKWIDLITSPTFVANPDYEAAYQAALVLGLDSEPKSAGYSARFAGWFKGPFARRDAAKVKGGDVEGVDANGTLPTYEEFKRKQAESTPFIPPEVAPRGTIANAGRPILDQNLSPGMAPAYADTAGTTLPSKTAQFYGITDEELAEAEKRANRLGLTVDYVVRELKRKAGIQ